MSIERLICLKFPGVEQYSPEEHDRNGWPSGNFSSEIRMEYGWGYNYMCKERGLIVSKKDDQSMCVRMDTDFIFNRFDRNKERLFFANIMRSLLSDDKFYFEMQYKLIACLFSIKSGRITYSMILRECCGSVKVMWNSRSRLLSLKSQSINLYCISK